MIADLVLLDAEVITMTRRTERADAQALAVADGKIVAVGSNDEVRPLAGPGTRVESLGGRAVLPGFIDTHVHFMQMGLGLVGPSVYGGTSADEVLAAISQAAAGTDPAQVILLHGYDAGVMDRQVTGDDLDRAAPRHRVMIGDIGGHACIVNTAAWKALALPDDLVAPVGRLSVARPARHRAHVLGQFGACVRQSDVVG